MAIMVAVPDNASADAAVTAAIGEARHFDTNLVVIPLGIQSDFDTTVLDASEVPYELVGRQGRGDRDPAEAVLDELEERDDIARLVIGMKRRSRVGKALMGSVSQRLLLDSPVPVLAVKA
ncbi:MULTISPECIES: universal stress protein [Brevibacterium]|uniref:Universal stress protein n=1 Tax=Brevibacterium casei TaxID=33889 RepID=A0AB34XP64_9MICO|nr:universal stress protein [Brevibacterium casei]NJE67456.1 universal stress protein [Brevibacterium sp. LS14]KZE14601.1 universal stress protein [Brevibacterium casei]MBE4694204.1 universal stress protein [Brevibacterium casei]MBY3577327.1 universal stress protein [Brevibacterium casei]MCT1764569.1 universal stress protein [Brevibacterium casei]